MTEKRAFSLRKEPKAELYRAILELGSQHCPVMLLVVRDREMLGPRGQRALECLQPFLVDVREASSWPGTVLHGHRATVYRYETSAGAAAIISRLADRLYAWRHPHLPEDLCFLHSDGTPWLVSIAHERDAYFEMTRQEFRALLELVPDLAGYVRPNTA